MYFLGNWGIKKNPVKYHTISRESISLFQERVEPVKNLRNRNSDDRNSEFVHSVSVLISLDPTNRVSKKVTKNCLKSHLKSQKNSPNTKKSHKTPPKSHEKA